jgi:DNA-binding MarR family transcriptional regulator
VILELQRAAQAVLIRLTTELDGLSMVSPPELNALANLAAAGSRMTVEELRAAIGGRPAALSSILERLELRDLITPGSGSADPGDADAALVELTPAGADAAEQILAAIGDLERRAFAELPAGTAEQTTAALLALTEAAR